MDINKIIFTTDILRVGKDRLKNPQQINTEWVKTLFGPYLEEIFNCNSILITGDSEDGIANRIQIFKELSEVISIEGWAKHYNSKRAVEVTKSFLDPILPNSLVITFEAAPYLIDVLESTDTKYLDFTIHPLRFMNDYMFGVRTNIDWVRDRIFSTMPSENSFYKQAHIIKSRSVRVYRHDLPAPSSALFIGQTEVDASLIDNGKMIAINDIEDTLLDLSTQHESLYYKGHPHSKNRQELKNMVNKIKNCHWIEVNIYDALSSDRFADIYSFSSSALKEAKYFNKKSHRILSSPDLFEMPKSSTLLKNNYIPAHKDIISREYWEYLFSNKSSKEQYVESSIITESPIKYMLNMKWGK